MKTFMSAVVVVAVALVASAQDKAKTGAAAYDDFVEPWRSRFVKDWKEEMATARKTADAATARAREAANRVANLPKASSSKLAAEAARLADERWRKAIGAAKEAEKRLAELKKNSPPYIRKLRGLPALMAGDYGMLDGKFVQVIDTGDGLSAEALDLNSLKKKDR